MISIKDIKKDPEKFYDQDIELSGWIRQSRDSKNVAFIQLNDGTTFDHIQLVLGRDLENFDQAVKWPLSSAIRAFGTLVETPGAKQAYEVQVKEIEALGISDPSYPLQKKRHSFEYLRTIPHLRPRTNTYNAVFRLRSVLSFAINKFFNERDFVYVHSPIITASDAEGAGEMFRVTTMDFDEIPRTEGGKVDFSQDFFGHEAHLTVSGQLDVEAFCMAYGRVYTFGPTFRAENSNTPRHAAEFWMVEPEIAFADKNDCMDLGEDMIKYIISYCLEEAPEEMEFFDKFIKKGLIDRLQAVVNSEFSHISYSEAIEILERADRDFQYPVYWGCDLQTEHERYLSEEIVNGPVYIYDYPKDIKAFYMRLNDDNKTVSAFDLLVPGIGELIGGSQREERLDFLLAMMEEKGLKEDDYQAYLDTRRYGTNKHAGYGLGFERMMMYLSGMDNIRDVIPYPRTVNSLKEHS